MYIADYVVARCLSVRPSVTRQYSVEMVTRILKLLTPPGSHTILVFAHQTGWQYTDGYSPNGGVECKGV